VPDAEAVRRAFRVRLQEDYDFLMGEPYCYRPREILDLTGDCIERLKEATARRNAALDRRLKGDTGGNTGENNSLAQKIEKMAAEGKEATFEHLWLAMYRHMPGMTKDVARQQFARQQSRRAGQGKK
jgi:hypothetical protein